jgi:prepilin peptidase CpaA
MQFISLYMIFAMLATIWYDVTRYTIPNWLVGSVVILWPLALYLSPETMDWKMALAAAGLLFVIGYVLFALKVMGAGDAKLIAALGLWVGWNYLSEFVMLFAILGGIFCLFVLAVRTIKPYLPGKERFKPRLFQKKAPLPYGVAIAGAFLVLMYANEIPLL